LTRANAEKPYAGDTMSIIKLYIMRWWGRGVEIST
jgi:hypothetical protein